MAAALETDWACCSPCTTCQLLGVDLAGVDGAAERCRKRRQFSERRDGLTCVIA